MSKITKAAREQLLEVANADPRRMYALFDDSSIAIFDTVSADRLDDVVADAVAIPGRATRVNLWK